MGEAVRSVLEREQLPYKVETEEKFRKRKYSWEEEIFHVEQKD